MKLSNVALCLTSATFMLSVNAFAATNVGSGSVNLSGTVVDATCTITGGLTKTIPLDDIQANELSAAKAGSVVGQKPIAISLTACPASLTKLGASFSYTSDSAGTNYLENTTSGTGVRFGISTDLDNVALASDSVVYSKDYASAGGAATINAKVNAYRIGNELVEAGDVTSTATVSIVYN